MKRIIYWLEQTLGQQKRQTCVDSDSQSTIWHAAPTFSTTNCKTYVRMVFEKLFACGILDFSKFTNSLNTIVEMYTLLYLLCKTMGFV